MTVHPITMKPKPHKRSFKTRFQKPPPAAAAAEEEEAESQSDYAFKITKTAVSQICQSVGFKFTQHSALETLTHITTLYLQTLARTAVSYSNASNRTQSNIFDIINSLHDMSSVQGFTGGSTLHCNSGIGLLRSGVLKDIKSFVEFSDEIPFAKPIPRGNPISLRRNSIPLEIDELDSRGLHIPRWLSRFPDESSYKNCGVRWEKRREGGLALWENSDLVSGGDKFQGISRENDEISDGDGGDLAVERGKVKFKIGEAVRAQKGGVFNSFL
ncbi:transcription initiation factor TFIID [Salix suchowensis]|nr:transcription initiation factor TFIID [Salix suchowensis]